MGGHHELVFHKETGMLFKAGDAQDLANQILHLQEDEGLRNTLKQNGRKFVEQVRNWKNSVANYKSICPKLIAKAGPSQNERSTHGTDRPLPPRGWPDKRSNNNLC